MVNLKFSYHYHVLYVGHIGHFLHVPDVGHLHIISHAQFVSRRDPERRKGGRSKINGQR